MAKQFEGECDCGFKTQRYRSRTLAQRALKPHVCAPKPLKLEPQTCGACRRQFFVLVDDSGLCIRCDLILYPDAA